MYDQQMAMDSDSSGIRHYFCSQLLFYSMDSLMKPGNLVMVKRAAIGVPTGTLALCLKRDEKRGDYGDSRDESWTVQLMQGQLRGIERRYLDIDLEVL
jgi:hypothetical protein